MNHKLLLKVLLFFAGFSSVISAQTIPAHVPASGLAGWWPFSGNGNDMTVNSNHATVHNAVLIPDRYGNANSAYNCTSGYLKSSTTTGIPRGGAMSLAVWFNAAANYGIGEIICLGGLSETYWGAVGGNNSFTLNYGRGCGSTGSSLQNIPDDYNQWHHVVYVSTGTGGTVRVYYDGIYFGTSTTANTGGFCSTTNLYFGLDAYFSSTYPGSLDDIGIWNRALSDCEIWDLYTETAGSGFTSQPISQTSGLSNTVQFSVATPYTSSYQWQSNTGSGFFNLSNGGQYSGVTTAVLTVSNTTMSNNNQQFRCLINSDLCTSASNSATLTVNNDVGIREYATEHLFSVYPNPFSNSIHIKANKSLVGSIYVLYDYTGKLVHTGEIQQEMTRIEMENLAVGLYLLNVGNDAKQGIKIIKQ